MCCRVRARGRGDGTRERALTRPRSERDSAACPPPRYRDLIVGRAPEWCAPLIVAVGVVPHRRRAGRGPRRWFGRRPGPCLTGACDVRPFPSSTRRAVFCPQKGATEARSRCSANGRAPGRQYEARHVRGCARAHRVGRVGRSRRRSRRDRSRPWSRSSTSSPTPRSGDALATSISSHPSKARSTRLASNWEDRGFGARTCRPILCPNGSVSADSDRRWRAAEDLAVRAACRCWQLTMCVAVRRCVRRASTIGRGSLGRGGPHGASGPY